MDIVGKYIRRKSVEGHHQRRSSGSGPTSSGSRRNSKSDNTNKGNPFVAPYPMPPPSPETSAPPIAIAQEVTFDSTKGRYVEVGGPNFNTDIVSTVPPPPPVQRRRSRLSQDSVPPVVQEESLNVRNFTENANLTAQFSSVPSSRRASFTREDFHNMYANVVDYDQTLLKAAEEVDLQNLQKAIKQGANINAVNQFGQSALHLLCSSKVTSSPKGDGNNQKTSQQELLAEAQAVKNAIIDALKEAGAKLDARDYLKRTPAHMAVLSGNGSCLKRLIAHCADINAFDYEGVTPLHIACANNYRQSVMFLIYDDADPNCQDINGMTALHHAAALNHHEMVKLLLTNGVYPTIRDKCGRTAFDLAKQQDALRAGAVLAKASKFQQPSPGKLTPEQERLLKEEDEMNNVKSFEDLTIHMVDDVEHQNEIKTWQRNTAMSTMSSIGTQNPQEDIDIDDDEESFFDYNSSLILTETWHSAYDFENPIAGLPSPTPIITQSLAKNEGKKSETITTTNGSTRRNSSGSTLSVRRLSASDLPVPPSADITIQRQLEKKEERIRRNSRSGLTESGISNSRRNSLSSQRETGERRRSLVPL